MEFVKVRTSLGASKYYEISKNGTVRVSEVEINIPSRIKGTKKKVYKQVQLMIGGTIRWFYLHRIVIMSFKGPPTHPRRNIVDHIDGDSLNNNLYNLRYLTCRANNLNRATGLYKRDDIYYPRIAGFVHKQYGTEDSELAVVIRKNLVNKYIRWANRFPDKNQYPHEIISKF